MKFARMGPIKQDAIIGLSNARRKAIAWTSDQDLWRHMTSQRNTGLISSIRLLRLVKVIDIAVCRTIYVTVQDKIWTVHSI